MKEEDKEKIHPGQKTIYDFMDEDEKEQYVEIGGEIYDKKMLESKTWKDIIENIVYI